MQKYYLYILRSTKNNSYYIGSSNNLERRLSDHNKGFTPSTRNKGPWKIVFKQSFSTRGEARQRELRLKKFKSRNIIEKIIRDGNMKAK